MSAKSSKQIAKFLNSSALTRPLIALGAASVLFGSGSAQALDPNALPQDPNVVGGKDTFSQSGNTLNINQSTNRTVIDWRSFNIGSNAQTNFYQPNSGSIAVNRVNGSTNPSDIEGGLHANGQVWILNPNGVFFGKTARVDAAGIVASTANLGSTKAFMAGSNKLQMKGGDSGSVVNEGKITVGQSGLAAFVAPSVRNSGTIRATVGKVTLAAGSTYTLDLAGDHLVELGLGSVHAVVDNTGKIVNPGGTITLTAKAASQVVDSVVNVSGVVSASSARKSGGAIILGGDDINTASTAQITADAGVKGTGGTITSVANKEGNYGGTFSAKGGSKSGDGGKIETSGGSANVESSFKVDTSAAHGKTGTWEIDPATITINATNVGTYETALDSSNVNITANSTINLNATFDTSGQTNSNTLYLQDGNADGTLTVNLNADILLGSNQHLTSDASTVNLAAGLSIKTGLEALSASGGNLNLAAGTYTLSGELDIDKSVTITGKGEANTTIDSSSTGYGLFVDADNVSLSKFTFEGSGSTTYGIKVQPNPSPYSPADRLQNFSISHVTIDGSRGTGLDLNGVVNATISYVTSENATHGNGIALTDSADVNISHSTTSGNAWGGLALYQTNNYYDQQVSNITVASNNSFGELNPVYLQDESSSKDFDFATLDIAGYDYAVLNPNGRTQGDGATFIWLQNNEQAAIDFAMGSFGMVNTGSSYIEGWDAGLTNVFTVGTSSSSQAMSIAAAVAAASDGATVDVLDGTYTLSGELDIDKGLSLVGQSKTGTIITSNSTGYGINVTGDNVTLSKFTFNAPTAVGGSTYGIKVQPDTGVASDRLLNFDIDNVVINGGYRTGLDLNGVVGATIDHVTVSNVVNGNGIALTDSANVTLTSDTTSGDAWGGLALYQTNGYYDQQVTNITVNGSNHFGETNGIYAQDQSTSLDFGTIDLTGQGINYVAKIATGGSDGDYTFFQKTKQGGIDMAVAANTRYGLTDATVQGYAGDSVNGDNTFYVGFSSSTPLSIQAAIDTALSNATINVASGTYNESLDISKNVDIEGAGSTHTIIQPTALLDTGVGHKYDSDMKVAVYVHDASNVTLNGLTIDANDLGANAVVFWNNASGMIENTLIENPMTFSGAQTGQDLAVDATGGNTVNLTVSNATFKNWNKNAIDAVNGEGTYANGGDINLTVEDSTFTGANYTSTIAQNGILVWEAGGGTINATIDGDTFSKLGYNDPSTATAAAILVYGSPNATVTVSNSTFSHVQEYISTAGGSPNEIDATDNNKFDGVVASGSDTLDQLYAIEDHIIDGTDDSSNGLVRLVDGHVYATAAKDNLQAAVDVASSGDTIDVQAGTYTGSLDISKNVDLIGAGVGQTIIQPTALLDTGVGHKYDSDMKVDVYVHDASDVTISGFTIDGANLGANAVVFWNNASGTIEDSLIENPMTYSGVQTGQDLAVDATHGHATDLTVSNVTFQNWNKNAIDAVTGDGSSSSSAGGNITLSVSDSTFTGRDTGGAGHQTQNGIVLWERAGGTVNATVDGSMFSDLQNEYASSSDDWSVGVLMYGSPNGTLTVSNSAFSNTQAYISTAGGSTHEVDATDNNTFDGVNEGSATLDQLFAIEDKLVDGLDDTSNGLVRLVDGEVFVTAAKGDLANGIQKASTGDTVHVQDGTYTITGGYLNVNKSMSLIGESEAGVIIDARNASTYGLRVTATNGPVDLENFTLYGVTASGGYGLKAEATDGLTLAHITSEGAYKSEFDLNGVDNASLSYLDANGYSVGTTTQTGGNGISLTNSQNVTITHSTTENNAWGGLALYQGTTYGNKQLTDITVDGTNTFHEANGIYAQDQSSVTDIGTIDLNGQDIQYVATIDVGQLTPTDFEGTYTYFQKTEQGAIDAAVGANIGYGRTDANVQGYNTSSHGIAGNNTFYVGYNTDDTGALSIQAAVNAALAGATVEVLPGVYTGAVTIDKANLTLESTGGAASTTIDAGGAAKAVTISTDAGLGTITIDGFTVKGWTSGGIIQGYGGWSTSTAAVDVKNNIVDGPDTGATANGNGIEVSGDGSVVSGNTVNNVHLNSTTWSGSGIIVVDGSDITIENNTVTGADNGIAVTDWDNPAGMSGITITGNTISHAGADQGDGISIQAFEGEYFGTPSGAITGLTITNNSVTDSYSGLGIWDYSPSLRGTWAGTIASLSGNTFDRNTYQISTNFTGADVTPFLTGNTFDATAINAAGGGTIYGDLQAAVDGEAAGSTLDIAGTFTLTSQLEIGDDISLVGDANSPATIAAGTDFIGDGTSGAMILVDSGVTFDLSNAIVEGTGHTVYQGLRNQGGNTTVDNVDFNNISAGPGAYDGMGIVSFGGTIGGGDGAGTGHAASLTVTDSTFENIGRDGILVKGDASTATISDSTFTGNGAGDQVQYGIEVGAGGNITVTGNTITGYLGVASTDGSTSAGIEVTTYYGAGTKATIENNIVTGNTAAVDVGYDTSDTSTVTAIGNDFAGNGIELESTNANADFTGNWWGTADDAAILALMSGAKADQVNFSTYLTTGTDTSGATGFQGDFSNLTVTTLGGGTDRIAGAIALATTGGTINVNSGTYAENVSDSKQLEFDFGGNVTVSNFTLVSGAAGSSLNGNLASTGGIISSVAVSLNGNFTAHYMEIDGTTTLLGDTSLDTSAANGNITLASVTGGGHDLTIDAGTGPVQLGSVANAGTLEVDSTAELTGSTYTGATLTFAGVDLLNNTAMTASGNVTVASVDGEGHSLAITGAHNRLGNVADTDTLDVNGPLTLTGTSYAASFMDFDATTLTGDTTLSGVSITVTSVAGAGHDLTIDGSSASLGDVSGVDALALNAAATVNGNVSVGSLTTSDTLGLTGDLNATGAVELGGASTITGNVTSGDFTADSTFALNGDLTSTGAIELDGAATLVGDVTAVSFTTGNILALNGDLTTTGAVDLGGNANITGNVQSADFTAGAKLTLNGNLTSNGAVALDGAATLVGDVTAVSFTTGNTLALNGDLTTTGAVGLGGNANITGNVSSGDFTASNKLMLNGDLASAGAVELDGAATITGDVTAVSFTTGNTLALTGDLTTTGTVDLGGASNITGKVQSGDFTADGKLTLIGDLTASGDATFNAASTVDGDIAAASLTATKAFTLNGNATATGAIALDSTATLAGDLTAASIALNGKTTLAGDTVLDTSAANGGIVVASVDGTTAGGQSLSIDAGSGTVSLGNAGVSTRLGALTDVSDTTLTGTTYKAGSASFGGDVTLTKNTTIDTSAAAGDITFTGDIFGTADGKQSLTLIAGSGTGSAAANGDITLQDAGTSSLRLKNMTVRGNNFTADTVWLSGDFNATLTGNQVFAADTLHAGGNVDSNVGGNATGHIDADGNVVIDANGGISGTIGGSNVTLTGDDVNATVTAANAATVQGNTIEGSYTGNTVSLTAFDNVDANVTADSFIVAANNGSVDGTWNSVDASGSGVVDLNGQTTVGQAADVNANQLVVEGFTLPAGTTIGANGQLILPQGVLLGLLSPGGGKPKMILVHSVQQLGLLLSQGYTVIVIDLKTRGNDNLELASN